MNHFQINLNMYMIIKECISLFPIVAALIVLYIMQSQMVC